jgi:serine/threonine protein phosphatase PrpC
MEHSRTKKQPAFSQNGSPFSLAKSYYFFANSIFQSVTLFSFFWQRPETTYPSRNIYITGHENTSSKIFQTSKKSLKNDSSAEESSIERTLDQLTEKINTLNKKIERTLQGRKKDAPPTETLKIKLQTCIKQISNLLSELDEVGPPPYPVLQWEAERKKLDEMRKELEKRLYMKFLEKEIQDESSKQGISPPSDASTIVAQVMVDLQVNSEEEEFLKSLTSKTGFIKLQNKIKRTMNDSGGNMDSHKDHKNKSNQKSGSKATMANSIPELDEESDEPPPSNSSLLGGVDVNKLLENLSGFSDAKSEFSDESSESESSEEKQEPLGAKSTGFDFGVGNLSKQDLLQKLGNPTVSSEESESETSDETTEESPKPKKQEKVVFGDPKDKDSTKELIEQIGRLKGLKKKQTKEKYPQKVSKKGDRRDSNKRPKSVDDEDKPVTKVVKKPTAHHGSLRFRTKPPSLRIKDSSKTRELTKTEKIKDLKDRPKEKLNLSDFGGANTFEILKMLSQMRTQPIEESSESEQSLAHDKTDELGDFNPMTCPLIESFGTAEEMNKKGLIRGKKGFNLKGTDKSQRYQMEDTNVSAFPFCDCKDLALFCVFDGHAGRKVADELTTVFPKILFQYWNKYNKDRKCTDLSQIFTETYREVDEQLKKFEDEGSTATTIVIWRTPDGKRYFQCANLGDSSAFLYREGKAIALTQDHKLSVQSERKRIEETGTVLEPKKTRLNGLAVTRAFGDHFAKTVEPGIISVPHIFKATEIIAKDTRIILASDGLWDVMGGQLAFDKVKSIKESNKAANKLVNSAIKNSKCNDNVTVTVINLR